MKKVFRILSLFVLVATMASITSCTKENQIVGKWKFSAVTVEVSDPEAQAYVSLIEAMVNESFEGMIWEFKSDNTLVVTGGDMDEEDEEGGVVTYAVDGDKLTVTDGTESTILDIVTLTSSKLVVGMEEEEEGMVIKENIEFTRM